MGKLSFQNVINEENQWTRLWTLFDGKQLKPWTHLWRLAVYFFEDDPQFRLACYSLFVGLATIALFALWSIMDSFRKRQFQRAQRELLANFPTVEMIEGMIGTYENVCELSQMLELERATVETHMEAVAIVADQGEGNSVTEARQDVPPSPRENDGMLLLPKNRRIGKDIRRPAARTVERSISKRY